MTRSMLRLAALTTTLVVATSLAQDKKPLTTAQKEAVSQVKAMAMKERQSMMAKTKEIGTEVAGIRKSLSVMDHDKIAALDAQVVALQNAVNELQAQLAKEPRYFDDPLDDPLRP